MSGVLLYVDEHPRLFLAVVVVAGFGPWVLMAIALFK